MSKPENHDKTPCRIACKRTAERKTNAIAGIFVQDEGNPPPPATEPVRELFRSLFPKNSNDGLHVIVGYLMLKISIPTLQARIVFDLSDHKICLNVALNTARPLSLRRKPAHPEPQIAT